MTVLIDNRTNWQLEKQYESVIYLAVEESLLFERFEKECEISVSIVDNKEIQQINQQFRNINHPTDVLSFPQLTFEENEKPETNEKGEILLGDIILSIEKAKSQAQEYGHVLKREIAFLTVHSMLHLLGYDHMTEQEEKEMFDKQEKILEKMNIPR